MSQANVVYIIGGIWIAGFLYCLLVAFTDISDVTQRDRLRAQPADTFGPQITAMTVLFWGTGAAAAILGGSAPAAGARDYFAIAASLIYCGIFVYIMYLFHTKKWSVERANETFVAIRPYAAFIVTGLIAFYFGTKPDTPRQP